MKVLHESCLYGLIYTQEIGLCTASEKHLFLPTTANPSLQMRDSWLDKAMLLLVSKNLN